MNTPIQRSLFSRIVPGNRRQEEFPQVRYFATLGELAEDYGGTTNVLFHRSNVIAEHSGQPIDILVFGPRRDYSEIDRKMHSTGHLHESVHFRSMWAELATLAMPASNKTFEAFKPLDAETGYEERFGEGVPMQRFRKDQQGRTLQIDMLREDGTVIVSDRRDAEPTKSRGQQSLILCDSKSNPIREFGTLDELRFFWLDHVIGDSTAVIFSDSFRVAGTIHAYRRPNVIVVQTFHNNHIRDDADSALSYTNKSYLPFLSNLDAFDATVFMSERQLEDLNQLMGPARGRWVIPNSRSVDFKERRNDVPRTAGIMVGRLAKPKQFDHAIKAITRANAVMDTPLTLEIYGEGNDRGRLEEVIDDMKASTVTLKGYDPDAARAFAASSFSLLTSRSESFSLVLVESMARGCIPIAYDVRYGPSSIITDGVDGFLVDPGDVDGLVKVLIKIQQMGRRQLDRMRRNARRRAKDFSDTAIVNRWLELLTSTIANKHAPKKLTAKDRATSLTCTSGLLTITISCITNRILGSPRAHIVLIGRNVPAITRFPCELAQSDDKSLTATGRIHVSRLAWFTEGVLDVSFELSDEFGRTVVRVSADDTVYEFGHLEIYPTAYGNLSLRQAEHDSRLEN